MKKYLALLLALLLLLLAGCGGSDSGKAEYVSSPAAAPMPEPAMTESAASDGYYGDLAMAESADMPEYEEAAGAQQTAGMTEKLIYRADLTVETVEFDAAVASLERLAPALGGFIESSDVSGTTSRQSDGTTRVVDRWASYVIRVPSSRFEEAVRQAGDIGNVTNSGRSVENITSRFIDQEARKHSLEVQEERLLSMLEKAEDVDTLVILESRLSEVRYEIESIERTLRNWQQQVDYSTVCVSLREVAVYTPTVPVQRTFSQRLGDAFSDGWNGFVESLEDVAVFLAEALPALLLLGVVSVAILMLVLFLVRRGRRRRQARRQPPENPRPQPPANPSDPPQG